jgi:glycosyltransferase involved in cell wall biosynthesis
VAIKEATADNFFYHRVTVFTMKTALQVTAVIPTFNCRERVEGAIRSTLVQDPLPIEVIVVDDGSTDGTDGKHLVAIDPRVKYIRLKKNHGGGAARNAGVDAASGNWLAFLDADDRWVPQKLSKQMAMLDKCRDSLIFGCANVQFDGGPKDGKVCNCRPPRNDEDISRYFLIHLCTFQTSTLIVPTQLARTVRFNNTLKRHQDWDFVLRLIRAGAAIGYSHEPLALYWDTEGPNRISKQRSVEPTIYWIRNAGDLIAPEAATALYFRACFLQHLVNDPMNAIKMGCQLISRNPTAITWLTKKASQRIFKKFSHPAG